MIERGIQLANLSKKKLGEILVESKLITKEQLQKALILQKNSGKKLGEILESEGYLKEDDILEVLEFQLGVPHVKLDRYKIDEKAVHLITETIARKNDLIPIKVDGNTITVAMADPLNIFAIDDVTVYTGKNVQPVIAKSDEIKRYIDKFFSGKEAKKAAEDFLRDSGKNVRPDMNRVVSYSSDEESGSAPIIKLVNTIFEQAILSRASDIHIEPFENELRIKYRIDGILYESMVVEPELQPAVVARIKVMGNMDIAERRIPQDGRTSFIYMDREYDMRISSLPTVYGEKMVVRIQDKAGYIKDKSQLGFEADDLEKYNRIVSAPHGIILVSGPTGSGKTTTLYTILQELNTGRKNIITVEDPVECKIYGVNQVEVNQKAGLTFASALRSILRQDPDIIMIGEIRDSETAEIAVRAAITGHLVLSTIHTNDAPTTVDRLIDMGVENFLISSSLIGVISQRLVRKICPYCKEEYTPDPEELFALGLNDDREYKFYRGKGCNYCSNKGYLGRTGIYEIMAVNRELRSMMLKNNGIDELSDAAVRNGMKTIREGCIEKILKGETTVEEYMRVAYSID